MRSKREILLKEINTAIIKSGLSISTVKAILDYVKIELERSTALHGCCVSDDGGIVREEGEK